MKKNKSTLINDEIDINNFVQNLWQHKILILSISILSMLLAYTITPNAKNNPIYFKSTVSLKKVSKETFETYQKIYYNYSTKSNIYIDFHNEFNEQFIQNFLDLDNILVFLEESKDFDDLKIFLKSKKISLAKYFYDKNYGFEINNIDKKNHFFFFILPEKINSDKFMTNYSNFIFDKTKIYIKNLISREIDNIIIQNQKTLAKIEGSNSTDLFQSFLKNQNEKNLLSAEEILQNISSLEKKKFLLDNHLSNLTLKLNSLSQEFTSQVDRPNSSNINALLGLIFGFFLSLVIIFFKKSFLITHN